MRTKFGNLFQNKNYVVSWEAFYRSLWRLQGAGKTTTGGRGAKKQQKPQMTKVKGQATTPPNLLTPANCSLCYFGMTVYLDRVISPLKEHGRHIEESFYNIFPRSDEII